MTRRKGDGVNAVNREFARYDQVDKSHTYRLSESSDEKSADEFDDDFEIQTCDMSSLLAGSPEGARKFASELGNALERIGFAVLTGHGVEQRLYEEGERAVVRLFTENSEQEKLKYRASRHGSVSQGYFPHKETSDIHPDLVEGWVFCRRAFALPDRHLDRSELIKFWPSPELEPIFRRIVEANERLMQPLMQSVLRHLECDPHLYDERLTATNFGLRLNYYPPIESSDQQSGAGRLLGHEDVDLFTILPAPKEEGLQVFHRESGKWVRLAAPPGSIILNTGDYMQRITNDRLPSTTHRVSKPRDPELHDRPRISIPMAVYLWEEELLEVLPSLSDPKYEPIRAITFHTRSTSKFYGDDYAVS